MLVRSLTEKAKFVCVLIADSIGWLSFVDHEIIDKYKAGNRVRSLTKKLRDQIETVRASAVDALGRIGEPAVPALIEALRDENETVRQLAASALGRIGEPAVPALIDALGDESATVRGHAASALGRIGEPAVPALIDALGDESATVRGVARTRYGIAVVNVRGVPVFREVIPKGTKLPAQGYIGGIRIGRRESIDIYEKSSRGEELYLDGEPDPMVRKIYTCRPNMPDYISDEDLCNGQIYMRLDAEMSLRIIVIVGGRQYEFDAEIW